MGQLHPWYWKSQPLCDRTGSTIFAALFRDSRIATLLESPPSALSHSRYSICAGPPRILAGKPQVWTPALGSILNCLQQRLQHSLIQDSATVPPSSLPFIGGWLGWLGYDLAWEIEVLPQLRPDPLPFPVAYWYEPEQFAVLDHQQQQLWLAATNPHELIELENKLKYAHAPQPGKGRLLQPHRLLTDAPTYEQIVRRAQAHIQAGDIFQANLSVRFQVTAQIDPWDLYLHLHRINPSPFASYWRTPWGAVVSCSPERLVQLQGRQAQVRPIAGTRSRGLTSEHDQRLAQELSTVPKEQAEHIMLVDLERNDLGRVCQWGSVAVDELLTLEYYSHVMHLVSNVVGTLSPTCNAIDLIRSVFPGGTITGCPKVRCMEIIEQLEPLRRSLFYGSCGYLDARGHLDLNILIRTLLVVPEGDSPTAPAQIWGQVGAGIVADSQPQHEWQESLHKAQAQLAALQQITSHA